MIKQLMLWLAVLGLWMGALYGVTVKAAQPDLKQGTMGYCEARARLAREIVKDLEEGLTTQQINIQFPTASQDPDLVVARERWVQELKDEVDAAAVLVPRTEDEWVQRVTQKIAEACWYAYGKDRVQRQAASSDRLQPDAQTVFECKTEGDAAVRIRSALLAESIPREQWFDAYPIPAGFSDDAIELINKAVEEAYGWNGSIEGLRNKVRADCMARVRL